ncbi:MAG: hypothetical protein GVY10_09120 [Verrucomicrobia bacterium]|jgi:hypothetical protein|nr:hypothetical protein [Verrucomicrobiota bacterium]
MEAPAEEMARLYLWRWQIEVCFRDIKTTLGMELLGGKSPAIAELLRCIAFDPVPIRPNRKEPRAVKRRPKAYQLLTRPRHHMNEFPSRRLK